MDQIFKNQTQLNQKELEYWLNHDVFSANWWFIVFINFLFLVLLLILIDRQRILIISLTFIVSFTLIGLINESGKYFGLWSYPHQFLPFVESFNAVDFMTIPVIFTLIYQTFSKWKYYLIAILVMSLIIGFIFIPVFVHFNFYKLHNWNYFYSFLTMLIVGCLLKLIVNFIKYRSDVKA